MGTDSKKDRNIRSSGFTILISQATKQTKEKAQKGQGVGSEKPVGGRERDMLASSSRKVYMKMSVKQKERVVRILEVLKSKGCVSSYRIGGDEIDSVVPEWQEGGLDRVLEEVSHQLRPFGLRQADRGWLVLLLPNDRRAKVAEAMIAKLQQALQRMGKRPAGSTLRSFHAESRKIKEV